MPASFSTRSFVLLLTAAFLLAIPARAQGTDAVVLASESGVRVSLGGTFQGRLTYAQANDRDRLGFGIRRAYLRTNVQHENGLGAFVQLRASALNIALHDAFAQYTTGSLRFRLGRFAGAQPRPAAQTSHLRIDAADRAAVGRIWAAETIGGDGRDFGFETQYAQEGLTLRGWLHNGHGSDAFANFSPTTPLAGPFGPDHPGLAVSGLATYESAAIRGLELGGFLSYNGAYRLPHTSAQSPEWGSYLSYAGHLYWGATPGSQPVRLKADLVGINFDTPTDVPAWTGDQFLGYALLGAVRVHPAAEVLGRFEQLAEDHRAAASERFYTVGGSLSLSALRGQPYHRQRLTLAITSQPVADDEFALPMAVFQVQLAF